MDEKSTKLANEQTKLFYNDHASSFSDTRSAPWNGWYRVKEHIDELGRFRSLLDIGCGNLRFESFLNANGLQAESITALDVSDELVAGEPQFNEVDYRHIDIIEALDENCFGEFLRPAEFDVAVAFGFMHHVPRFRLRKQLLDTLVDSVSCGGLAIVSFWQFSRDKKILEKALRSTERANSELNINIDPKLGDYFLGWQDNVDAYRYCHDFSAEEIDELIDGLNVVDRFEADGKNDNLNTYVVIKKI